MKNNYNFLKIVLIFIFLKNDAFAMEYKPSPRTSRDISSLIDTASFSSDLFGLGISDMKLFAEMLGCWSGNLLEQCDSVSLAKKFVEQVNFNNGVPVEKMEQFSKAFYWAAEKGWVEVIKIFLANNTLLSILKVEFVRKIFTQTVRLGHICVVSELLKNEYFLNKLLGSSNGSDNLEEIEKFHEDFNCLFKWILENEEWPLVKGFLINEKVCNLISLDNIIQAINKIIVAGDDEVLSYLLKKYQNILSKSNKKHFLNLFNKCQSNYQYPKMHIGRVLASFLGKPQDSCIVM